MNRPLVANLAIAGTLVLGCVGVGAAVTESQHAAAATISPVTTVTSHHDPVFIRCEDKTGDDDMQACYHAPTADDPRAYLIWHEEIWISPDLSGTARP